MGSPRMRRHRARRQPIARLVHRLVAAQDLAGQNQGPRPFARRRQPLLENRHIRAHFARPGGIPPPRFGIALGGLVGLVCLSLRPTDQEYADSSSRLQT
jgi:hypothetical protein